jgi:hypothetical protein
VRVIVFVLAGRRANMELQLPLMRRVLAEHPQVDYHIWNLARADSDNRWLRKITGKRMTVVNSFYGPKPAVRINDVYRHYSKQSYRNTMFVKLDDDVVFIETARFGEFVDAIAANPDTVCSAKVINNGACTRTEPALFDIVRRTKVRVPVQQHTYRVQNRFVRPDKILTSATTLPLLDVHLSLDYARRVHRYALDHFEQMINQPVEVIPTQDWLSINMIGYNHDMGIRLATGLGKPSPAVIAGRIMGPARMGDEGVVNTLPRAIVNGFTAVHLSFGVQHQQAHERDWEVLRTAYGRKGRHYLLHNEGLYGDIPCVEQPLSSSPL